jgi:hypothetical protein
MQTRNKHKKFFIDSTPLSMCETVPHAIHYTFRGIDQCAHSSFLTTFGLMLYIVAGKRQKIVGFMRKPGNLHNVPCAEELLRWHRGIVIRDKR